MLIKKLLTNLNKMGEAGIYFAYGIVVLLLGRVVWNLITKYNSNDEIGNKDNVSAGIAEFGFLIALALIITASLRGTRAAGEPIYIDLLVSFLWAIFGLIALAIGKVLLDLFTPFKLDDEISRDTNQSAGWLQAGFYIAVSLILFSII
jgi:uncharacterized membrane protein YjfL (UPF0719 family)